MYCTWEVELASEWWPSSGRSAWSWRFWIPASLSVAQVRPWWEGKPLSSLTSQGRWRPHLSGGPQWSNWTRHRSGRYLNSIMLFKEKCVGFFCAMKVCCVFLSRVLSAHIWSGLAPLSSGPEATHKALETSVRNVSEKYPLHMGGQTNSCLKEKNAPKIRLA